MTGPSPSDSLGQDKRGKGHRGLHPPSTTVVGLPEREGGRERGREREGERESEREREREREGRENHGKKEKVIKNLISTLMPLPSNQDALFQSHLQYLQTEWVALNLMNNGPM